MPFDMPMNMRMNMLINMHSIRMDMLIAEVWIFSFHINPHRKICEYETPHISVHTDESSSPATHAATSSPNSLYLSFGW